MGAGAPLPVRVRIEIHPIPGRPVRLTGELDSEPVCLDQRDMLDQTTERHRAGGRGRAQTLLAEA